LYEKLGLKNEDEKDRKAREEADERRQPSLMANENVNEQFCGDHVPDEMASLCDWKKPIMELGSRYKDMATFRLAMRQYAIKKKFELDIEASTRVKYSGYCKGGDCPWRIHASFQSANIHCMFSLHIHFLCMFLCFNR
jgi:hypothetical protein